jgi:hypothetical protein
MKNTTSCLCLIGCCLTMVVTVWAVSGIYSVQVRKGQIRQQPSFLGQVIKELSYGDRVEVVRADASGAKSSATSDEIALAGKGFDQAVESAMKAGSMAVNYGWVDYMEQIVITPSEMEQFLSQGGVQAAQGGA